MRTFSDLLLREDVVSALAEVGVTEPTLIQMLAIPKILRGKNVLCASETGNRYAHMYEQEIVMHYFSSRIREDFGLFGSTDQSSQR